MIVQHFCNSFIKIELGPITIVCDPWISTANHGSWQASPFVSRSLAIDALDSASHIYISHLHTDHFSEELLKSVILNEKTFIIQKFPTSTLYEKLKNIGATSIIELEPWQAKTLGQLTIAIVPQIETNSEAVVTEINYLLDTSIFIHDTMNDVLFFNKVDNPLSADSLQSVVRRGIELFGRRPDIATFNVGAASEYPQCFTGIDRDFEMSRIIQKSLAAFAQELDIVQPKFAFPAGGSYILAGSLTPLNRWLAIPSLAQLATCAKNLSPAMRFENISGGSFVDTKNWSVSEPILMEDIPNRSRMESVLFDYQFDGRSFHPEDQLCFDSDNFYEAQVNFLKKVVTFTPNMDWDIRVALYHDLTISDSGFIVQESPDHFVTIRKSESGLKIVLHMDCRAFDGAVRKMYSWNQLISGSHAMIEREPNVYEPDVLFSLNFLTIS